MVQPVRRVVAGQDESGKAVIQMDSDAPKVRVAANGIVSTLLWVTEETPADNSGSADTTVEDRPIPPPPNGSIFRTVDFPPEDPNAEADPDVGEQGAQKGKGHPGMHKTNSIDYAIIMEGEIDMMVDDGKEVHLKAGDVVVQRGNMHAWVNRTDKNCRIAFILIDSKPI